MKGRKWLSVVLATTLVFSCFNGSSNSVKWVHAEEQESISQEMDSDMETPDSFNQEEIGLTETDTKEDSQVRNESESVADEILEYKIDQVAGEEELVIEEEVVSAQTYGEGPGDIVDVYYFDYTSGAIDNSRLINFGIYTKEDCLTPSTILFKLMERKENMEEELITKVSRVRLLEAHFSDDNEIDYYTLCSRDEYQLSVSEDVFTLEFKKEGSFALTSLEEDWMTDIMPGTETEKIHFPVSSSYVKFDVYTPDGNINGNTEYCYEQTVGFSVYSEEYREELVQDNQLYLSGCKVYTRDKQADNRSSYTGGKVLWDRTVFEVYDYNQDTNEYDIKIESQDVDDYITFDREDTGYCATVVSEHPFAVRTTFYIQVDYDGNYIKYERITKFENIKESDTGIILSARMAGDSDALFVKDFYLPYKVFPKDEYAVGVPSDDCALRYYFEIKVESLVQNGPSTSDWEFEVLKKVETWEESNTENQDYFICINRDTNMYGSLYQPNSYRLQYGTIDGITRGFTLQVSEEGTYAIAYKYCIDEEGYTHYQTTGTEGHYLYSEDMVLVDIYNPSGEEWDEQTQSLLPYAYVNTVGLSKNNSQLIHSDLVSVKRGGDLYLVDTVENDRRETYIDWSATQINIQNYLEDGMKSPVNGMDVYNYIYVSDENKKKITLNETNTEPFELQYSLKVVNREDESYFFYEESVRVEPMEAVTGNYLRATETNRFENDYADCWLEYGLYSATNQKLQTMQRIYLWNESDRIEPVVSSNHITVLKAGPFNGERNQFEYYEKARNSIDYTLTYQNGLFTITYKTEGVYALVLTQDLDEYEITDDVGKYEQANEWFYVNVNSPNGYEQNDYGEEIARGYDRTIVLSPDKENELIEGYLFSYNDKFYMLELDEDKRTRSHLEWNTFTYEVCCYQEETDSMEIVSNSSDYVSFIYEDGKPSFTLRTTEPFVLRTKVKAVNADNTYWYVVNEIPIDMYMYVNAFHVFYNNVLDLILDDDPDYLTPNREFYFMADSDANAIKVVWRPASVIDMPDRMDSDESYRPSPDSEEWNIKYNESSGEWILKNVDYQYCYDDSLAEGGMDWSIFNFDNDTTTIRVKGTCTFYDKNENHRNGIISSRGQVRVESYDSYPTIDEFPTLNLNMARAKSVNYKNIINSPEGNLYDPTKGNLESDYFCAVDCGGGFTSTSVNVNMDHYRFLFESIKISHNGFYSMYMFGSEVLPQPDYYAPPSPGGTLTENDRKSYFKVVKLSDISGSGFTEMTPHNQRLERIWTTGDPWKEPSTLDEWDMRYDNSTKTLTLNELNYTHTGTCGDYNPLDLGDVIFAYQDLNLELVGENTIMSEYQYKNSAQESLPGIIVYGKLSLSGTGSLHIASSTESSQIGLGANFVEEKDVWMLHLVDADASSLDAIKAVIMENANNGAEDHIYIDISSETYGYVQTAISSYGDEIVELLKVVGREDILSFTDGTFTWILDASNKPDTDDPVWNQVPGLDLTVKIANNNYSENIVYSEYGLDEGNLNQLFGGLPYVPMKLEFSDELGVKGTLRVGMSAHSGCSTQLYRYDSERTAEEYDPLNSYRYVKIGNAQNIENDWIEVRDVTQGTYLLLMGRPFGNHISRVYENYNNRVETEINSTQFIWIETGYLPEFALYHDVMLDDEKVSERITNLADYSMTVYQNSYGNAPKVSNDFNVDISSEGTLVLVPKVSADLTQRYFLEIKTKSGQLFGRYEFGFAFDENMVVAYEDPEFTIPVGYVDIVKGDLGQTVKTLYTQIDCSDVYVDTTRWREEHPSDESKTDDEIWVAAIKDCNSYFAAYSGNIGMNYQITDANPATGMVNLRIDFTVNSINAAFEEISWNITNQILGKQFSVGGKLGVHEEAQWGSTPSYITQSQIYRLLNETNTSTVNARVDNYCGMICKDENGLIYAKEMNFTGTQYQMQENNYVTVNCPIQMDASTTKAAYLSTLTRKVSIPIIDRNVESLGYSISLNGTIGLNYYFEAYAPYADYLKAYYTVGTKAQQEVEIKKTVDAGRYMITIPIAATEMDDAVIIAIDFVSGQYVAHNVFKDTVSQGEEHQQITYSVKQYADYILGTVGNNSELAVDTEAYQDAVPLVRAMLNYGGYAQDYFGDYGLKVNDRIYDNSYYINPPQEELIDPVLSEIQVDNKYKMTGTTSISNMSFYGASLMCKDNTYLKLYYSILDKNLKSTDVKLTVTNQETKKVISNVSGEFVDGKYVVTINDIPAAEIGTIYQVTINASGKTISMTYSPMIYINKSQKSGNTRLTYLTRALFYYNKSAQEYFQHR